jgi:hypothetical protein
MSLVESTANISVGFLLALCTQIMLFPLFGILVSLPENLMISGIFTAVSLARTYVLRRLFEALQMRWTTSRG